MTMAWPDLSGKLEDGGHVLPIRVYYEDTDFTGFVYHGALVRFLERGRSDFLRLLGIHHHELNSAVHGVALAFAVKSMTLDFMRPARIDNVVEVRTRLVSCKGARIVLEQSIARENLILAQADVTVAIISTAGKPTRLPPHLVKRLTA